MTGRTRSVARHLLEKQVSLSIHTSRHEEESFPGQEIRPILEGRLTDLPPISSKTVRVFLSSTFSDMIQERNSLMEHVYPKLKTFCREKYGLEFQMVDLRWGIRQEAQDDHTIIDVCMQEIDNCKKSSVGPNFVALIGQKYGYRPFPPKIQATEFCMIREALLRDGKDVAVLDEWFKRDENCIKPMYFLQPISSILVEFNNKVDVLLQHQAQEAWNTVFSQIQELLRYGAMLCWQYGMLDEKEREKYFVSVTEYEIDKGMMEPTSAHKTCLCFYRCIQNLHEHVDKKRTPKFTDLVPGTSKVDTDAQELLRQLKEKKIRTVLADQRNVENFFIHWPDPDQTDPNDDPRYLDQFCIAFHNKMKMLIIRSLSYLHTLQNNPNLVEVLQHLTMCRWRSDIFRGREGILQSVQRHLAQASEQPLVVYGESGSGKTSVVAKAASMVTSWFPDHKFNIILRFLGTTARSCSIRLVLGNVCWQIARLYGLDINEIPAEFSKLVLHFHSILGAPTAESPLVIFLDSLDQLSGTHRAHHLAWLPTDLPPNVHIIVSTVPGEFKLLQTLQSIITLEENFVQILPLGAMLSTQLVREWLCDANRTLSGDQFEVVWEAMRQCSLPLYTRLIYEEVSRWKSFSQPDQTTLEPTVRGVINTLFDRVERYHGKVFVKHTLSYITASKNGLSDTEMEDILSLDEEVLNDVYLHWVPPVRRVPPLLLPRLLSELSSYIMKREANGIIVFYWYHRQFIAVASERYLKDLSHVLYIHTSIAHYFMGTWGGGAKKPFRYSVQQMKLLNRRKRESLADRKVPKQPWIFQHDANNTEKVTYNMRKLSELPFHLVKSRRYTELKTDVLFTYEFLYTKLKAMGLQDVLSDFRHFLEHDAKDAEVQLLGNALRVGGSFLNKNPDTLAFDLLGRLLPYYNDCMSIRNLLGQCDTQSIRHSAALPLFQCFDAPKGMLVYILEDHSQVVYDILFSKSTNELVSVSKDNTISFWDLRTSERTRRIDITALTPGANTRLFQSADGTYLICDSDSLNSPLCIYDLKTGRLLHEVGRRDPTSRRVFVAGNLFCRQKDIINLKTGEVIKTIDDFVTTKRYVTCNITPNERFILIGEDNITHLFDIELAMPVAKFVGSNLPSLFVITPDSKTVYVGYTEDCTFKIFNIDPESVTFGEVTYSFNHREAFPQTRFLEGPRFQKELAEIATSPIRQNIVLLNIKRCHLLLLNMLTNKATMVDVKAIGANDKTYLFGASFSVCGNYILAGNNQMLHIWNSVTGKLYTTMKLHTVYKFPLAIGHYPGPNLVATGSTIHTAINVWNLDKIQTHEPSELHKYGNPVDMVTCAPERRLLFVKEYYGLSSVRGYKYHDSFGIDVWNMNTGSHRVFLPFALYGELHQMNVSADAQKMALLLKCRDETYLCILNLKSNKLMWSLSHHDCHVFLVAPMWDFAVTASKVNGDHPSEIILWNLQNGEEVARFVNSDSPVFTLDNAYLIYVSNKQSIIVYSLKVFCPILNLSCQADVLQTVPNKHHMLITTKFSTDDECFEESPRVSIWYYHSGKVMARLCGVAPRGILDISKDGSLAVDRQLHIFNLKTGEMVQDFLVGTPDKDIQGERKFVKFTYDGKYLLWAEQLSIKVGRVQDRRLVANVSTHETPTSLTLMDYGYIVVIGRADGHLLTLKLVLDDQGQRSTDYEVAPFRPYTLHERMQHLLSIPVCSEEAVHSFETVARPPLKVKDSELPRLSEDVQGILQTKAKVHGIIKTASLTNLAGLDDDALCTLRRGSTPAMLGNKSLSNTSSPSDSPISGSPVVVRRKDKAEKKRSTSASDLKLLLASKGKRSNSTQDLFSLGRKPTPTMTTTTPNGKPVAEMPSKARRKSPSMQALMNTAKAIHSTGMLLVGLGHGGGGGGAAGLPPKSPFKASTLPLKAAKKTKVTVGSPSDASAASDSTNHNNNNNSIAGRGRSPSL